MSDRAQLAIEKFSNGFNCNQAVLSVFAEDLALSEKTAISIASGFGGGARNGQLCGAVAGVIMALGLKYYDVKQGPAKAKQLVYEKVVQFTDKFKARNGSIVCKELLGCDISTPEGDKKFESEDLHNKICCGLVKDAVQIVEKIMGADE